MQIDPQAAREFSIDVVRRLRAAGYEAFWAGGCVRDMLLGKRPEDYDVATNAQPDKVREIFGRRRSLPIGASFGVITVVGPKPAGAVEVATFREDSDYSDGRRPDRVTYCSAEHDAQRRDFTINGLFFDPISRETIDYVGGVDDLHLQIIRAIGDPHARIREDKLRMLRAIRFTATLGFQLDSQTKNAVCSHANEIDVVSAERVTQELRRMFAHAQRVRALVMLRDTTLLAKILPEFSEAVAKDGLHDVQWARIVDAVEQLQLPNLSSVLAILFHHAEAKNSIDSLGRRLRLSRDEMTLVRHLLANEQAIRHASDDDWPRVQRILIAPRVDALLDYCQAVAKSEQQPLDGVEFCRAKQALPKEHVNPDPLIDGGDLKRMAIPEGPEFKKILNAVRDEQLLGNLKSKAQAIEWLRSNRS